ncbi:aerobic glycerol-3-phosphate dehydrogenase [Sporosarcina sp. NCCP-2222]|uniref:glycerol-3-phosphate dehydrogenase/oxidase n=1 Tax=Sporosarcina sp. NCCP-2222 TaxID=2935073 RepID=UPI0020891DC7|nr:glycerol-3-phosphate dehydrogenase/oxidase [Sporosarcina sp. NCCP-2222]GKV55512.1 aerobic glycerol-3-phosphate dehydrogenase [Sporosarcina sp. NCCP-2222]
MLSAMERPKFKQFLQEFHFDLLVIGGGITGAGIALDAVTRGLSVALVEMQDYAAGTSSRSTKLVHGGLRYLKQLDIKIVAETGKEREIVYSNALHVTEPERMLLPFHKGGTFGRLTTSAGLFAYDKLAGVRKEERREMLASDEVIQMEPLVRKEGLLGGGHYVEYRTDDSRLTMETLKKAAEKGAVCLNYMKVEHFNYDEDGNLSGAALWDMLDGDYFSVNASVIVNATGPWVDEVRKKDSISNDKRLRLTKGIHIVIDKSIFPLRQAIYFDAPDGRMIFAIPRGRKAYIGTTDTFFDEDRSNPAATEEDVAYLLEAVHYMFPSVAVDRQHVESTWAGVRPLIYEEGKKASEISRKDEIWESETGLITIAGGKLTGYRKMAETVVDRVAKKFSKKEFGPCVTEHLRLSGGEFENEEQFKAFRESKANEAVLFGLTKEEGFHLAATYGTNVDVVYNYAHAMIAENSNLPAVLKAEILYAIHYEMAMTPSDFFIRRTGDLYFHIAKVKEYKDDVTDYMSRLLAYSNEEKTRYLRELEQQIELAQVKGDSHAISDN